MDVIRHQDVRMYGAPVQRRALGEQCEIEIPVGMARETGRPVDSTLADVQWLAGELESGATWHC